MATETFDGATNWVCPSGVFTVQVECWGAGGSGAGNTNVTARPGGGGGAYAKKNSVSVTPGQSYFANVGNAGVWVSGNLGEDGEDTYFIDAGTVMAKGGRGAGRTSANVGGPGGAAADSVGDTKFSGGAGGDAPGALNRGGSGGGGSGGTAANGNAGAIASGTTGAAGGTAVTGGGPGGSGANNTTGPGNTPSVTPGGGGGAAGGHCSPTQGGGSGRPGRIRLTYTVVATTLRNPSRIIRQAVKRASHF